MLTINKAERINIDKAITHQWLTNFTKSYLQLNKKIALDALSNMRSLKLGYGFQKVVLVHMVKSL